MVAFKLFLFFAGWAFASYWYYSRNKAWGVGTGECILVGFVWIIGLSLVAIMLGMFGQMGSGGRIGGRYGW